MTEGCWRITVSSIESWKGPDHGIYCFNILMVSDLRVIEMGH